MYAICSIHCMLHSDTHARFMLHSHTHLHAVCSTRAHIFTHAFCSIYSHMPALCITHIIAIYHYLTDNNVCLPFNTTLPSESKSIPYYILLGLATTGACRAWLHSDHSPIRRSLRSGSRHSTSASLRHIFGHDSCRHDHARWPAPGHAR